MKLAYVFFAIIDIAHSKYFYSLQDSYKPPIKLPPFTMQPLHQQYLTVNPIRRYFDVLHMMGNGGVKIPHMMKVRLYRTDLCTVLLFVQSFED